MKPTIILAPRKLSEAELLDALRHKQLHNRNGDRMTLGDWVVWVAACAIMVISPN